MNLDKLQMNNPLSLKTKCFRLTVASTISVLAFLVSSLTPVMAADTDPEAWRADKPKVSEPRPFKVPEKSTFELDNGLKVQMVEDHRVPWTTVYIGFKAGTSLDKPDRLGIAEATADQLNEGTDNRTSKQFADDIDLIGGRFGAFSDYDFTIVSASSLSNYKNRLMELVTDAVLHPSYTDEELKIRKDNWLQELVMQRTQPSFLVEERFSKEVFGSHPYSVVSPHPDMVSAITRDDLRKFHKTNYVPNGAIMLVIGDFDPVKMKELITSSFGKWEKGQTSIASVEDAKGHKGTHVYLIDRPESVQSSIKIGNIGIKKTDPDFFAIRVMNQILGGGANSRLFLNIREQKGYTYGAYSSVTSRVHPGSFSASADVRTEVTGPSVKEFLFELGRIRDKSVSKEELEAAKNYLAGQFQLELETQSGLAQRLLEVSLFNLPSDYLEHYAENIMSVSVEDVQRVANRVIQSNDLVIAVVGDAKKIKQELEPFGPVDVFNTSGEVHSDKNPTKTPES
jgi:Predicted Zn-dependent peptidases